MLLAPRGGQVRSQRYHVYFGIMAPLFLAPLTNHSDFHFMLNERQLRVTLKSLHTA